MLWRYYEQLEKYLKPRKALIIYGPRRVGKTTLLENFLKRANLKFRLDSGENVRIQQIFASNDFKQFAEYTEGYDLIAFDNGIRNAPISQFNKLSSRNDTGPLWENFIFTERIKNHSYQNFYGEHYFWRTYEGQEIDLVETVDNTITAYEFKFSPSKGHLPSSKWAMHYPSAKYETINPDNYLDFLL